MTERHLFRGKKEDNGEWIIGYLTEGRSWKSKDLKLHINSKYEERLLSNEVDPSTIGQCTGLKDKCGKLIFEGDIILTKFYGKCTLKGNFPDYDIFKVIWHENGFCIENQSRLFGLRPEAKHEITGNIHDTPELLLKNEGGSE